MKGFQKEVLLGFCLLWEKKTKKHFDKQQATKTNNNRLSTNEFQNHKIKIKTKIK